MDLRAVLFSLAVLVAIVTSTETDENQLKNSDVNSEPKGETLENLVEDPSEVDKRRLMRYGRGGLLRYGRGGTIFRYGKRGTIFRYGKRGTIFRYGKRDEDDMDNALADLASSKRLFRYGKRDDSDYKRLFRWGKRSDDEMDSDVLDAEKRRLMRYGKRDDAEDLLEEADKRGTIFRYGKRDGTDEDELAKRIFRYGKRDGGEFDDTLSLEEAKRRIMRYGRDIRAQNAPHVPFRFGREE